MSEELMSLATQCLDICQELESKGKAFTFNLTITGSNSSFSLDTKKNGKTKEAPMKKKQPSPSTVRRNLKRKLPLRTMTVTELMKKVQNGGKTKKEPGGSVFQVMKSGKSAVSYTHLTLPTIA